LIAIFSLFPRLVKKENIEQGGREIQQEIPEEAIASFSFITIVKAFRHVKMLLFHRLKKVSMEQKGEVPWIEQIKG
jgi:hypothetical protein